MNRTVLVILISLIVSTNMWASSDAVDSIKLEAINSAMVKELGELSAIANNRNDYGSKSFLKTIITRANKLNKLSNEYYSISNDSSVFFCSFIVEFYTAIVYEYNNQTDSAYAHSLKTLQLYEPYGRMFLNSDTTQQMSKTFFGEDGIISIIRDWHIEHNNIEDALKYNTIIADSCRALNADVEVVKSYLKQGEIYETIDDYKKSIESQIQALDMRLSCTNYYESPLASQIYVGILNTIEELTEKVQFLKNKESFEWIKSDSAFLSYLNNFFITHPFDFCDYEEKNGNTHWVNILYDKYIHLGIKFKLYNSLFSLEEGYNDYIIRNYGKESTELAECLMTYSLSYNLYSKDVDTDLEKEKFKKISEEKEKKALEIWKNFFDQNPIDKCSLDYLNLQNQIASQNFNNNETIEENNRLHDILMSYLTYMESAYSSFLKSKKFDLAYNTTSKTIDIKENVLKVPGNSSLYQRMGFLSFMMNDFTNAESYLGKAYSLALEQKDTITLAEVNLFLYRLYAYPLDNQIKARQKLSEAYKLVTEYSCHSIEKIYILEEMANFYKSSYNYILAHNLILLSQTEKIACGQTITDEDYIKNAEFLFSQELKEDSTLFNHIQEIAEKEICSESVQKALELLALTYVNGYSDYEKGIYYYQKAAKVAHELNDTVKEALNTAEIGTIYFALKKYNDALTFMQKAEKINPRLKYRELLTLMAHIHNDSIVESRLPIVYESTTTELKKKLLSTSAEGRDMMVHLMPYDILTSMMYYYPNLSISTDIAYNSALLYKGLLQNTQKTVSEYIANSNDKNLKSLYDKLQIVLNKVEQDETTFEDETQSQVEASELEIKILEELSKKKALSDLEITWDKVIRKLGKNDVAIEFVEISRLELFDRSSFCYGALIIRRGFKHPVFVVLSSKEIIDNQIDVLLHSNNSNSQLTTSKWKTASEQLYKDIWGKLSDYINPGDNVYFSAAGMLHQAPIEILSNADGVLANEINNMFRLSSTRELCYKRKRDISNAVLFGGLLYDETPDAQEVDSLNAFNYYKDSSIRSGWNYLPESSTEVDSISQLLSTHGVSTIKKKGLEGTEESFKRLSGTDVSMLHIATHGFYFPQKEVRYLNYFQSQIDISPMKRSGLMMTGGQTAWMGKKNLEQEHDGILTSEEISQMDLSKVSLVVLSACQTGLGDIDSGAEGVIGIQRAFKLAGVQSLLMSLWKVDDNATSYMMQEFYTAMLNGKSKRDALKTAQKIVRDKYPNPYYWAGFVLLD